MRVLITGASGFVAGLLIPDLASDHSLRLTDICNPKIPFEDFQGDFHVASLEDFEILCRLCNGVDTVVHLGAIAANRSDWRDLIGPNITGVQHVLLAARAAGCRRVILISSVQAVSAHTHRPIFEHDAPAPNNFYGASKAFAEAIGRTHSAEGFSVLCVRLGMVCRDNDSRLQYQHPELGWAITQPDLIHLMRCCIQAPQSLTFAVLHGVSSNRDGPLDIEQTRRLIGYDPRDNAPELAEKALKHPWRHLRRIKRALQRRLKFFLG